MIKDLLKWVAPGVATVLGGTAAAFAMVSPGLVSDLAEKGRAELSDRHLSWARIALDGRDILLSGTVESERQRDSAIATLSAVSGVNRVASAVTIAPLADPYRVDITIEDSAVRLSGSVPNSAVLKALSAHPGVTMADLAVRSGHPDETRWQAALDFALAQAGRVRSGQFELTGLTLSLAGEAASQRALGEIQMALADAPAVLELGNIDIAPLRVAPYTWTAEFDGHRIAISGYAPEPQVVERLRTADVSGRPVDTGMALASGAPDGFADLTRTLVEQLARLDHGRASIVDGVSRLEGAPPSIEVAQSVTDTLSGSGSIVRLAPPPVGDYWVSVTRQSGGVLVFDGYAPDEATRNGFGEQANVDVNFLKLGSGAPQIYAAGMDFGLSLLSRMSEGRMALRGDIFSLSGTAQTPTDYTALRSALETDLPQGLSLGEIAIHAPRAATYDFRILRRADGSVTLAGMLPDPALEARLLTSIGARASSSAAYASGEPVNFADAAEQAVEFLPWLREGEISFDGTGWTVSGTPASDIDLDAIETEFAVRGLVRSGWTLALEEPVPVPEPVSPYTWSAERLSDGSFLFAGHVPAPALQDYLAVHVGTRVADTSTVSAGAPPEFAAQARAATDALLQLQQGRAAFDGTAWTFSGLAADASTRQAALELANTGLGISAESEVSVPAATPDPASEPVAQVTSEPEPTPPPQSPPAATPAASDDTEALALCTAQLAELSAHNAILFQSGAAIIADSANAELDAFAQTLAACPGARVYVEGHTDSDGDDQRNLALSVARSEAVVNALIERGIAPERLYAIGYGESQPVADNATADGKRQNRRIVISLEPAK